MDELADALRASTGWSSACCNALRAGDATATGQVLEQAPGSPPASRRCGRAGAALRARPRAAQRGMAGRARRGVGIACMWYGIGNTGIANPSTMRVALRPGRARWCFYNGAVDIGQGSTTVMPQISADALGLPVAAFDQVMGDTDLTADAGKTSASRQTFVSGNARRRLAGAALRAALLLRSPMPAPDARAARSTAAALSVATRRGARARPATLPADANGDVFVGEGHFDPPTVPLDADGQGVPYATYGFAAQIAEVEVDTELGTVHAAARSSPRTMSAAPSTRPWSKARSRAASRRASAWR